MLISEWKSVILADIKAYTDTNYIVNDAERRIL